MARTTKPTGNLPPVNGSGSSWLGLNWAKAGTADVTMPRASPSRTRVLMRSSSVGALALTRATRRRQGVARALFVAGLDSCPARRGLNGHFGECQRRVRSRVHERDLHPSARPPAPLPLRYPPPPRAPRG